jgi:hypothetical protein
MANDNFARMVQLAEGFFETKSDPSQLSIDENVMAELHTLHRASMGEELNADGPVAWTIVLPATHSIMDDFISKKISEKEILELALKEKQFTTVYLCSALVLPEFRQQSLAKHLLIHSISEIQKEHSIDTLFFWAFSKEGKRLALSVAQALHLPLLQRNEN